MRAARQQDFLRQVAQRRGRAPLLDSRKRRELATLFARYTDTDRPAAQEGLFSLLKLVLFSGQKPMHEVRFRVDAHRRPGLPDRVAGQARRDRATSS